jgi:hypothetical protein
VRSKNLQVTELVSQTQFVIRLKLVPVACPANALKVLWTVRITCLQATDEPNGHDVVHMTPGPGPVELHSTGFHFTGFPQVPQFDASSTRSATGAALAIFGLSGSRIWAALVCCIAPCKRNSAAADMCYGHDALFSVLHPSHPHTVDMAFWASFSQTGEPGSMSRLCWPERTFENRNTRKCDSRDLCASRPCRVWAATSHWRNHELKTGSRDRLPERIRRGRKRRGRNRRWCQPVHAGHDVLLLTTSQRRRK